MVDVQPTMMNAAVNVNVQQPGLVMPSAPPEFTVQGYEGASFQSTAACVMPPTFNVVPAQPPPQESRPEAKLPNHINEQQAREALLGLAGRNLCWGKKAAREMDVTSISGSNAFHYKLETYTEARKSTWAFKPYLGGPVDGPQNGLAPAPWSITMAPDVMFKKQEKQIEVPHTSYVKTCHGCNGTTQVTCGKCKGSAKQECHICRGKGYSITAQDGQEQRRNCQPCNGTGKQNCSTCHGSGREKCPTCSAKGQLRYFLRLTVTWTIHMDEHIEEMTALPDHLITQAAGQVAYEEQGNMVYPIGHFPKPEINTASQRLVQKHWTSFNNERTLMQRHKVRVVPVSEVVGEYSGQLFTFWVYGNEHQAYAPRYPTQCCCGLCTIL